MAQQHTETHLPISRDASTTLLIAQRNEFNYYHLSKRRIWALALLCASIIVAIGSLHIEIGIAALQAHPLQVCGWIACFIVATAYRKKRSSIALACEHSTLPLLLITLMITNTYNQLVFWMLLALLCTSWIRARGFVIGTIQACTALAPLPLVHLFFDHISTQLLHAITTTHSIAQHEHMSLWLIPLLSIVVTTPLIRLLCDYLIFEIAGISIQDSLFEYSLSRILLSAATDLLSIIWVPSILTLVRNGMSSHAVLAVFLLALCTYSLMLMAIDLINRHNRTVRALWSIEAISDALPLPEQHPEQIIITHINRALKGNKHCIIAHLDEHGNSDITLKAGHSYRFSQVITHGATQYQIVLERNMFTRPWLTIDESVLQTVSNIVIETWRVNTAVTALRAESETDALTGALSYKAFISYITSLQTENIENSVAIAYFEVEQLRRINEEYGRIVGNTVLRTVADRLRALMPNNASLFRVNGDEFAIIIHGMSIEAVDHIAQTMRTTASVPIQTHASTVSVSVCGSNVYSQEYQSMLSLLTSARAHVYTSASSTTHNAALASGSPAHASLAQLVSSSNGGATTLVATRNRGKNSSSTAMQQLALAQGFEVSDIIRKAIEKQHIEVLYQPIVDITTQQIHALDTLFCLHDAGGQVIEQSLITHEAKRLGLSAELTIAVLQTALSDIILWQQVVPQLSRINICLSGDELSSAAFHELLESCSKQYVDPMQPNIIVGLQLGAHAIHVLRNGLDDELHSIATLPGMRIGLTHIGSTYSETAAFATLPVVFGELDPVLMRSCNDPRTAAIVTNTASIMQVDNFELVFDGVDGRDQLAFVRKLHGTYIRGALAGNPMSAQEWLMRWQTMGMQVDLPPVFDNSGDNEELE